MQDTVPRMTSLLSFPVCLIECGSNLAPARIGEHLRHCCIVPGTKKKQSQSTRLPIMHALDIVTPKPKIDYFNKKNTHVAHAVVEKRLPSSREKGSAACYHLLNVGNSFFN